VTGGMAGNLFLRAFERSDRIYMAMLSRGYDGEIRSLPLPELTGSQIVILAASLLFLLLLLLLSLLL
jgi:cobalt/nickel transport system permease protein